VGASGSAPTLRRHTKNRTGHWFKCIAQSLLNLLPLSRDRDRKTSIFIGFDRGRTVVVQIVEVVTELESGLHYLVPGYLLTGMTGGTAHERCEV
ncbi:MAG: hypothetical protein ACYSUD_11885, partial [Planctomycetota bacterium]